MTDAEARQQVCPHMTFCVNESDALQYKMTPIYTQSPCQGSNCRMAWRWVEPTIGDVPTRGYCGIAGKPIF